MCVVLTLYLSKLSLLIVIDSNVFGYKSSGLLAFYKQVFLKIPQDFLQEANTFPWQAKLKQKWDIWLEYHSLILGISPQMNTRKLELQIGTI